MSWFGFYAAKGFSDLVKGELAPSDRRGEPYLLPDERARQSAVARLTDDESIDASAVQVVVLSGVLRLSGSVRNEAMRARAEELCAALPGVTTVENKLSLA